jgi:hypothetical protein
MNTAELRALAERLCLVDPHDYEDRVTLEAAAEILELLAWAEEEGVSVERKHGFWWATGESVFSGDAIIDTLRRAREASKS